MGHDPDSPIGPAWFAAFFKSTGDSVISHSVDGTVLSWNRGAEEMLGYTETEAVGRPMSMVVAVEHRQVFDRAVEQLCRGRRVPRQDTVLLTKNGTRLEADMALSAIQDQSGKVVGVGTIARDVTEQRWMAKTLDHAIARLETALDESQRSEARVRRFLADAAHQLVNPLTAARACAEGLLRTSEREPSERCLLDLMRETDRAGRLVGSMLRMVMIDEGEAPVRQPCDVLSLCREQATMTSTISPQLQVTVRADDGAPQTPCLDARALEEILSNLLDNARRHAVARIKVRLGTERSVLQIRVVDDGPGMSEEVAERAFERFVTLDGGGGSGLGLPIARALARAHGGEVSYLGRTGGFLVSLP